MTPDGMTPADLIATLEQATEDERFRIVQLLLDFNPNKWPREPRPYPPDTSIGEMAGRWATWGVGPKARM